jgi:hypothetical protein
MADFFNRIGRYQPIMVTKRGWSNPMQKAGQNKCKLVFK